MNRPFLQQLRIQNLGCINDASFVLSPLHALIGPNDSGKSTVLRALQTVSDWASNSWNINMLNQLFARYAPTRSPRLELQVGPLTVRAGFDRQGGGWINQGNPAALAALNGCQTLRLDPDSLRRQSALIPDGQELRLATERGDGLPAVYDAIITRDVNAYVAIGKRLTELFPSVKSLSLKNPSTSAKALGIQLHDGTLVPAETMSEGLLYWLAFAALPYLAPTAMVLVEEPENGLHPSRIRDVVKVLREISQTTQVILATHSPLVINELEGHEVSIVTRGKDGTKSKLMKDTPNFEDRSKTYALGELWVSYANGEDEAPLIHGGARP